MPRFRAMTIVSTLWLCLAAGGCSQDRHVFISTVDLPRSIALIDSMRDVTLWEYDIPVEHKLIMDFDRPFEFEPIKANMQPATEMSWCVVSLRDQFRSRIPADWRLPPLQWQTVNLSGTPVIMKMTIRPAPEFPPDLMPTGTVLEPLMPASSMEPAAATGEYEMSGSAPGVVDTPVQLDEVSPDQWPADVPAEMFKGADEHPASFPADIPVDGVTDDTGVHEMTSE